MCVLPLDRHYSPKVCDRRTEAFPNCQQDVRKHLFDGSRDNLIHNDGKLTLRLTAVYQVSILHNWHYQTDSTRLNLSASRVISERILRFEIGFVFTTADRLTDLFYSLLFIGETKEGQTLIDFPLGIDLGHPRFISHDQTNSQQEMKLLNASRD